MLYPATPEAHPLVLFSPADLIHFAGILSRTLKPGTHFPIGALTSLIGATVLYMLLASPTGAIR
jgi:ABC-type Fe3+-siderophore transport system permease subunit